jgi:predicted ribosomally synthesized peptide with SipW-like signal peptide
MSKNNGIELSRRKALASLGAVGVASAGAGIGTSAYFTDEESFEGNVLTAGELDLVLDWQEQYSAAADTKGFDNVRFVDPETTSASDLGTDEVGIPTQENPSVIVDTSSTDGSNEVTVGEYMAATAIDSFPDTDGINIGDVDDDGTDEVGTGTADDGVQDAIPINGGEGSESAECQYLQPLVPDAGVLSSSARTQATDLGHGPNPQTTASGDPLVDLDDVKPGDFGEVTFSLHLCGNPGYISMTGDLVSGDSELLNAARGVIWYDAGDNGLFDDEDAEATEGDNILQNETEELIGEPGNEVFSGSLHNVLDLLKGDPGIPLDGDLSSAFSEVVPAGSSSATIENTSEFENKFVGAAELSGFDPGTGNPNPSCGDIDPDYDEATKIDSDEFDDVDGASFNTGPDGGNIDVTTDVVFDSDNEPESITITTDQPIKAVTVKAGSGKGAGSSGPGFVVYEEPDGATLDSVTFDGSDLGDKALSFVEICYEAEPGDPGEREPFPNSTTAFIGFAWWLPSSVGNEVQGQSLKFDIGFMAEQARHNEDPNV